ncbi:DnaJ domain-containing protein [Tenacibaculum dicentrarchi]|uniref:DnaJ domain-containing protein n=1 Tax=Tenacibaculum dicentrarchi TaxID=669041 RepID=UPI0035182E7B
MKNHYQTLGIKRNVETKKVKQAYKKLALKFHPDKNNGDKYFEERFKEIQESYETLTNPQKKIDYDRNFDSFFSNKEKENQNQLQSTYKTQIHLIQIKKEQNENKKKRKNKWKHFLHLYFI